MFSSVEVYKLKRMDSPVEPGKVLDEIEKTVYAVLRPIGFRKYGRTLHRYVSGDISQAITFQLGQSYRGETHLLFVDVGIRVPECMTRSFIAAESAKKYYQAFECNIRSRLGAVQGGEVSCYDLRKNTEPIIEDILRQIRDTVLPTWEIMNSRDAILAHRREFPDFDLLNNHLILLEEAMIHGHRGNLEQAAETFRTYYRLFANGQLAQKNPGAIKNHLRYLDTLAEQLQIQIPEILHTPIAADMI